MNVTILKQLKRCLLAIDLLNQMFQLYSVLAAILQFCLGLAVKLQCLAILIMHMHVAQDHGILKMLFLLN